MHSASDIVHEITCRIAINEALRSLYIASRASAWLHHRPAMRNKNFLNLFCLTAIHYRAPGVPCERNAIVS